MAVKLTDTQTEVLIEMVRERPCLYDYNHCDYKKDDVKSNNWKEIAVAIDCGRYSTTVF